MFRFTRRNIFYVGGMINPIAYISQSALYFMDLTSKSGWVLQSGKMSPPGLLGQVRSSFVLEERFLYHCDKIPLFARRCYY